MYSSVEWFDLQLWAGYGSEGQMDIPVPLVPSSIPAQGSTALGTDGAAALPGLPPTKPSALKQGQPCFSGKCR